MIPRALPFTTSNTVVHTFRHAISLDERRAKFKANLWNRPEKHEELLSISDQKIAQVTRKANLDDKGKSNNNNHHRKESQRKYEGEFGERRTTSTDVDEVNNFIFIFE